ncbi:MAG: glycosyltransferase family 4 protein, partial [Vicinamibacterales bacterium]
MKLCIPIVVKPEGGMYTFIGNLTKWLTAHAVPHTTSLDDVFDVLFVNSWAVAPRIVERVKRAHPQVKVVQRVDGSAEDYGGNPESDRAQARVNLFADLTIFQSEYSKHSTRDKFRLIAQDGPVIYNPVDSRQFAPDGPRLDLPPGRPLVACASWSVNRRKGTWQVDQLAAGHPGVSFVLCGRFEGIADRANVIRLGHLDREAMAAALRSCDVFLNLSENDPCPNVVLEALASGLPVLYRDSGGVRELVGDCGLPIDGVGFAAALDQVLAERPLLSARARERVQARFTPDQVFPRYLAAIEAAARRPPPSTLRRLQLRASGYPVL